jgi:hypothetical protein
MAVADNGPGGFAPAGRKARQSTDFVNISGCHATIVESTERRLSDKHVAAGGTARYDRKWSHQKTINQRAQRELSGRIERTCCGVARPSGG